MKRRLSNQRTGGLTLVEVLVSIAVVALMAVLVILYFANANAGVTRINCVSNLKQIGLAMRMWSSDHDEKFPWNVSTNKGGTMEFADKAEVFRHYLAISNELTSPKVLACPTDSRRTRASSWDQLTNNKAHLSYFVGLASDESRPRMILSGDRNLTINGRLASGLVTVTSNTVLGVAPLLHTNYVNVGLADGSAQQVAAAGLQKLNGGQFARITNQSVLLAIP